MSVCVELKLRMGLQIRKLFTPEASIPLGLTLVLAAWFSLPFIKHLNVSDPALQKHSCSGTPMPLTFVQFAHKLL